MHEQLGFEEVGKVGTGELVLKIPGTNLKMAYTDGTTYVNASGTIACLSLNLTDMVAEESKEEAAGMMASLGEMIREQLSKAPKELIQQMIKATPLTLLYSEEKDGKSILTLPGMSGEDAVDDENFTHQILAFYSNSPTIPVLGAVLGLHSQAIEGRVLVQDRDGLSKKAAELVDKANEAYETALGLMEDLF